jgi:toxin ParE1/3/4
MKVVYTEDALNDLAAIADWLILYPAVAPLVERRIRRVVTQIARWPESSRRASTRPGVRVVPLGRYPYKIFYRVSDSTVEVLHIMLRGNLGMCRISSERSPDERSDIRGFLSARDAARISPPGRPRAGADGSSGLRYCSLLI